MIRNRVDVRNAFWSDVEAKIQRDEVLNGYFSVVSNTTPKNWFRDLNSTGFNSVYRGNEKFQFQISVACEPGKHSAVPQVRMLFLDGEDEAPRDRVYQRLRHQFPNLFIDRTHTHENGLSKIVIRRRQAAGTRHSIAEESEIVVGILRDVAVFLAQ